MSTNGTSSAPAAAGPARPRHRVLRTIALILLIAYAAAALALLLTPSGWWVNRANVEVWFAVTEPFGLQRTITPDEFQGVANIVLFVPAFAALAVLRPTWWWVALGAGLSACVETYQLVIGTRQASVVDVLMNTLGALIGVAIGRVIIRRARARVQGRATGVSPAPDAGRAASAPPAPGDATTPPAARGARGHGPGPAPDDRG